MASTAPDDYITIADFKPGIFSASGSSGLPGGSPAGVTVPAPLGAAQQTNTFRCRALPSGGLCAMPGNTFVRAGTAYTGVGGGTLLNGAYFGAGIRSFGLTTAATLALGSGGGGPEVEVHGVAFNSTTIANNIQRNLVTSATAGANQTSLTIETANGPANSSNLIQPIGLFSSRANVANFQNPGNAFFGYRNDLTANLVFWPDPNNTGANAIRTQARTGQIFGHQGRIILLEPNALQNFGGFATNQLVSHNELISFSDPPNSDPAAIGTQKQVFYNENPSGYGAWGSVSASELFLVKQAGGAVMISGDVAFPQVTRLPGVVSTGGITTMAGNTTIGVVYLTKDSGCYAWNGNNTSQKLSPQLDDLSWDTPLNQMVNGTASSTVPKPGGDTVPQLPMAHFVVNQVEPWDDLIITTNNWIYDTVTNGWWRLEDPGLAQFQWFSRSYWANLMWCQKTFYTPGSLNAIFIYDKTTPAASYSWQSHIMPVTMETMVDISEVVLVAQAVNTAGTVTVTLTAATGRQLAQPAVFQVTSTNQPQRLRLPAFCVGYNIIVRIQSSSNNSVDPAPIVHSLSLGWKQGSLASST